MSFRYQIRIFESTEKDGATAPGTIVTPISRTLSMYAYSAEEAEKSLRRDIEKKKLPRGKVYQICPVLLNGELIRSFGADLNGSFQHVFLDPAAGPYDELRAIRLPRPVGEATESESAAPAHSAGV
jgi:hypothetical protein